MDENAFWALIGRSREQAEGDLEAQAESLQELLTALPAAEIVAFDQHFAAANLALYSWSLWGAATLMLGWCSDDVFTDFRSWVISQGRPTYDRVAADPEALAEVELTDPDKDRRR